MILHKVCCAALGLFISFTPVLERSTIAQEVAPATAQGLLTLQNSLRALSAATVTSDVTLTGTVRKISGSDDRDGIIAYSATPNSSKLDMNLSGSKSSEIRVVDGDFVNGMWTDSQGLSHQSAAQNIVNDPGLFPAFVISKLLSSKNLTVVLVGTETRNGVAAIHLTAFQQFPQAPAEDNALMQHLSQVEMYVDPVSFLPISYIYNAHPNDNELRDIPTEIRYDNYQREFGIQRPLHVQQYINNSLVLDIQFQNILLNSGLTTPEISVH